MADVVLRIQNPRAVDTHALKAKELISDNGTVVQDAFHSLSLPLWEAIIAPILAQGERNGESAYYSFRVKYFVFMVSAEGIEPSTY